MRVEEGFPRLESYGRRQVTFAASPPGAVRQSQDPDYDQVDGDDVVQKPWRDKDQNARDQSRERSRRYVL